MFIPNLLSKGLVIQVLSIKVLSIEALWFLLLQESLDLIDSLISLRTIGTAANLMILQLDHY